MRIIVEGELGGKAKLFKPLMFRSQVVRGIHYIIKVCNLVLQTLCLRALTPGPMQFLQCCGESPPFPFVQSPLVLALQVLVDDEKEKGCVHLKVLQEPEAKKLVFAFVGLQKDKNMDEAIENFQ